ncbi:MAG TPA: J domain-containing protein, partial [Rhodospirillales bacterium]|nr:J domain-containing protein [Rhodospirillales bacterium]
WFCLDHVRLYNASWNYYQGMNDEEVEADLRNDTVWNRPSWALGSKVLRFKVGTSGMFDEEDVFGGSGAAGGFEGSADSKDRPPAPPPGSEEAKSLSVLGLAPPLTVESVKTRYKELVKRYHPDANGGNKDFEEKFKQVNLAYRTIMDSLGA